MKIKIAAVVVAATIMAGCQTSSNAQNFPLGPVLGGVAGGFVGNQFGSGTGNTVATALGAVGGVLLGLVHSPRRTFRAWRAGFHPDRVPLQAATLENYERLLQLSVGELRELYGVPSSGITGARQLHYAAPSRIQKRR